MTLASDFLRFDDELASRGVPPLSPFWRSEATRFFDARERGEAGEFWCAVGRGGAKSTFIYKVCVFETLFGEFTIPADERHFAIVLSRVRSEAEKGLTIIAGWLTKLGIAHHAIGDVIELESLNRGIRVVTASVASASGWRAYFLGCDEFAKWRVEGVLDADADEVLASARAMLATHPTAMVTVASSPWISEGSFYQTVMTGDGEGKIVTPPTPSWVANPIITEASTRARERNERRWRREYNCEFVDSFEGGFFSEALVANATDRGRGPEHARPNAQHRYVIAIDPAFSFDRFAVCIAHAENRGSGPTIVIDFVGVIDPPRGGTLSPEHASNVVVNLRKTWPGGAAIHSDQAFAEALRELFGRKNTVLCVDPWSAETKRARFSLLLQLMHDGKVRLPDDVATRREFSGIGLKLTNAGNETIVSRGAHDDRVSCIVHATYLAHRTAPGHGLGSFTVMTPRTLATARDHSLTVTGRPGSFLG